MNSCALRRAESRQLTSAGSCVAFPLKSMCSHRPLQSAWFLTPAAPSFSQAALQGPALQAPLVSAVLCLIFRSIPKHLSMSQGIKLCVEAAFSMDKFVFLLRILNRNTNSGVSAIWGLAKP